MAYFNQKIVFINLFLQSRLLNQTFDLGPGESSADNSGSILPDITNKSVEQVPDIEVPALRKKRKLLGKSKGFFGDVN